MYIYQKLRKLAGSRQSYCKNYQAYFFWPTLYVSASTGRVIALTLTTTVSVEVHLKSQLTVTSAGCCDGPFVNLCALFVIV